MPSQIYIASQSPEGGIYRCILNDGKLSPGEKYPLDRPAYMCFDGGKLHVLLREPFMMQSGIVSFRLGSDGRLYSRSSVQPVHGAIGAHILAVSGRVYCTNYLSGSTILMPDKLIAHNGSSIHPQRQTCSHPHCVTLSPEGEFICITDLGTDSIYICSPELEQVSRVSLPPGSGPRHLVFSPDGSHAYCTNELSCTVGIFRYTAGRLDYIGSRLLVPPGDTAGSSACALRLSPDGKKLFASTRGYGSIAVFRAEGASLSFEGEYRLPGAWIRDFNISGDYLLCGDERSNRVLVYSLSAGFVQQPLDCFPVEKPWCILVGPHNKLL